MVQALFGRVCRVRPTHHHKDLFMIYTKLQSNGN